MLQTVYRRLSTLFTKWELWYHAVFIPTLVPICNFYFIGPRYFSNWRVFIPATLLLTLLYILSTIVITYAVRWVIARYPDIQHSTQRTLALLVVLGSLSIGATLFDIFIFSLVPSFGTQFTWSMLRPVILLVLLFDFIFGTSLSLFYTYRQWHKDQAENEQLRQATYQNQLDALKLQINPHFLFNSLTSLSSLIGEDRRKASQFVDELAKVYRYLLQANKQELVSLQTELNFIISYGNLLQTRYGPCLHITHAINDEYLDRYLPATSLQTLIDNAMKHNSMLVTKPLTIRIETTSDGALLVQNNLQRKVNKLETYSSKLKNLVVKYQKLSDIPIQVEETPTQFSVRLPLLADSQLAVSSEFDESKAVPRPF